MPTLNLFTNVPVDAVVASDILKDATKAVAKIIGKPESRSQLQTPKHSTWLSSNEGARLGSLQRPMFGYLLKGRSRTNRVMCSGTISSSPIVLSFPSPAKSVDPTTFLQISVLLLSLYWLSNFIVPELISRYFQFDKVEEDKKQSVGVDEDV
ncbi:hypothetical protein F8388_018329 [Cannabis sativa]|uniref:Uncharacterized protein n=1 Tax=Cannabis sativa TaxID=3483 RepID=A0A7J6HGR8_CANSA|nr:hypothetical protein F8388_018329 [Cannabis sativa]